VLFRSCMVKKSPVCESGMYLDPVTNDCRFCDVSCLECTGPRSENCIKCPFHRPYLQSNVCVASCSKGYFKDAASSYCFKCNSKCAECKDNAFNCLSCKDGFQFDKNANSCFSVIFYDEKCFNTCYECYGLAENQCKLCKDDLVLFEGKCLKKAAAGFFKLSHKNSKGVEVFEFRECKDNCKICQSETMCLACEDNHRLIDGICYKNCELSEFMMTNNICAPCKEPCLKCKNESYCTACQLNKFHLNGACLDTCPLGFHQANGLCLPCHPSCESCLGESDSKCLSCNMGFVFKGGYCKSTCIDGTFYNKEKEQCELCDPKVCQWCIESPQKCTKCFMPLVLDKGQYTCKACCSRSIHGKIKEDGCCNCDLENGLCVAVTSIKPPKFNQITEYITKKIPPIYISIFAILCILIFAVVMIFSIKQFFTNFYGSGSSLSRTNYTQLLQDVDDTSVAVRESRLNSEEEIEL